jgi:hypothetical protein
MSDTIGTRDKEVGLECYRRSCKMDAKPEEAVARIIAAYREEIEAAARADEREKCAERAVAWLSDGAHTHDCEEHIKLKCLRAAIKEDGK